MNVGTLAFCALSAAIATACSSDSSAPNRGRPAGATQGTGGLAPTSAGTGGSIGTTTTGAGGSGVIATPDASISVDGGDTCAEEAHTAELVPVDLLLLSDASSSMLTLIGTRSKWQLVNDAILKFIADPGSTGLGLGVQFFPKPGDETPCNNDTDCGFVLGPTPPACQPQMFCTGAVSAAGRLQACGVHRAPCSGGAQCVPAGLCSESGADCTNIGSACPGRATDTCTAVGKLCEQSDATKCQPVDYQTPTAPITMLPQPATRFVTRALALRGPGGATPLGPAVQGALAYLKTFAMAHPGHRSALVLATDGTPAGCMPTDINAIGAFLAAARMGSPEIGTYVIGVFAPGETMAQSALQALATAGGTGMPFVVNPGQELTQEFLDALSQIRGQALPCEFPIPPPKMGMLDFKKVNLTFTHGGNADYVLYAQSADRCDPVNGGWYYDVNPDDGGVPTRVVVCPATCAHFKMDTSAQVELRFGCKTRVIVK